MKRLFLVPGRLLCLIFVLNLHYGVTQSVGTEFGSQLGQKVMDGFVYFEGVSVSAMSCAAKCSRNGSCLSAAFNQDDMSCALSTYRVNGLDNQHRLEPQAAWTAVSKKDSYSYWIGISDIDVEGQFVWISDGISPTYDGWTDGQPNIGTKDDCVVCTDRPIGYKWADRPCKRKYESICEI